MIPHEPYQNLIIEKYVCKIIILAFHHYSLDVSVVAIFAHELFIYLLYFDMVNMVLFDTKYIFINFTYQLTNTCKNN